MFDALFNAVVGLPKFYDVMNGIKFILENLAEEHLKDPALRNEAIDAVMKILEAHKAQ